MEPKSDFMNPPENFSSYDAYILALHTIRDLLFKGNESDFTLGVCATIWNICNTDPTCYSKGEVLMRLKETLNRILERRDMAHAYVFYLVFGLNKASNIICDIANNKAGRCCYLTDGSLTYLK